MRRSAVVLELGEVDEFQEFTADDPIGFGRGIWECHEPCYMVVIYRRTKCWAGWSPRSVEDVPPNLASQGLFSCCQSFGEALQKTRSLNSQWLKRATSGGPAKWATVSCIDRNALHGSAPVRAVTPLDYRSQELQVAADWIPRHLLDVPITPWKRNFSCGGDLPVCGTLEPAFPR